MAKKTKEKIDTIGRDEVINNMINIIEAVSANKGNTTFALDGPWGSGKTFVLEKLEDKLSNFLLEDSEDKDNKYFVIHYNCWKYDYYEEPLIAIVSAVLETLNEKKFALNEKQREKFKKSFSLIGNLVLDLVNIPVKACLGVDVKKVGKQVGEFVKGQKNAKEENHKYDDYFKLKEILNKITKGFEEITEKQTIVFIIDELDRCLPEYAIKVLERLHHITDSLENIVTIIGIDEKKLSNIIGQTFGYKEEDCSKYLKKFVKFSVQLNIGTTKETVVEKYQHYINLFDKSKWNGSLNFLKIYNLLFHNIDIREQENLMEKALMIHTLITSDKVDVSVMYTELILLVMEHYYRKSSETFFSSGKFCNVYNYINESCKIELKIEELNSIINAHLIPNIDAWTQTRIFTINQSSKGNGLVYWYFSKFEHENSSNNHLYYITLESDDNYHKYCLKNYEIVKKFKDFIETIK